MRPTIYGKQLVTDSQGNFVGVNIGYNFFAEHEEGTANIVRTLNNRQIFKYKMAKQYALSDKNCRNITKKGKESAKLLKRWVNTPFKDFTLINTVDTFRREIIINNSEIKSKYNTFLLKDGHYTLFHIGTVFEPKSWEQRFGRKRTMTEEDILYMQDYNSSGNLGFMLAGSPKAADSFIVGSWDNHYGVLLVIPEEKKFIIDSIEDAIKRGCLAVVGEERRLFKDRGCCLIDLDRAYFGRK